MDNNFGREVSVSDKARVVNSTLANYARVKDYAEITSSIVGEYSAISQYSLINKSLIKKFTSIGHSSLIGLWEHNTDVSTHSFYLYESSGGFVKGYREYKKDYLVTEIGNDVWVGGNVTILKGIKIGDGAIIGAGSVVTKDVPPYAIVVGNPGKILKYRFNKEDISFFLQTQWWDFPREKIQWLVDNSAFDEIKIFKEKIRCILS